MKLTHEEIAKVFRECDAPDFTSFARAIERIATQRALGAAAEVCEKHCVDLLHDKDIQKHWPRIKTENDNYAALIRAMAKEVGV